MIKGNISEQVHLIENVSSRQETISPERPFASCRHVSPKIKVYVPLNDLNPHLFITIPVLLFFHPLQYPKCRTDLLLDCYY